MRQFQLAYGLISYPGIRLQGDWFEIVALEGSKSSWEAKRVTKTSPSVFATRKSYRINPPIRRFVYKTGLFLGHFQAGFCFYLIIRRVKKSRLSEIFPATQKILKYN